MAGPRVLYVAGPGNVIGTHAHWQRGDDDPGVPDVAYSRQFFDAVTAVGGTGWVIAARPDRARVDVGAFRVEHRPIPLAGGGSLAFVLGRAAYTLGIVRSARAFRADVVVAGAHGVHWGLLRLLRPLAVRVVPVLHNTLWALGGRATGANRWLLARAAPLFRSCAAVLAHPGTCVRQLEELTGGRCAPIRTFLPFYRPHAFADVPPPPPAPPFRVLFVGRVEADKGVFDLLEVARRFAAAGRTDLEFDVCGDGSRLAELQQQAAATGVAPRFRCHGRRTGAELRGLFAACHTIVVPTRAEFFEGFNAVVAEAVLAGRPVVTSAVCPALDVVRDAAIEVAPGDVAGYQDALARLCDDHALYAAKRAACAPHRATFCEPRHSFAAALQQVLADAPGAPR
jgi:glycogen(starch) synthase